MKKAILTTVLVAMYAILFLSSCKKNDEVKPVVSNPIYSMKSGTYKEAISVGLSCSTDGASIFYTTDGTNPTNESNRFTSNIVIKETTTVKAIACKDGCIDSDIVEAKYVIETQGPDENQVSTPEFVYPAGTYVGSKIIAIKCDTEDATIYYTTDGSDPTDNSTEYKISFKLTESATVKAIAYKKEMKQSEIAAAFYEIIQEKVKTPKFSISGGTFDEPIKNLAMSCDTEGATIHFTLNGDEPTESSPVYSQPLSFSETTTVKAKAFKNEFEPSDIAEQTYIIEISTDGTITVVNSSGTHEFTISYVAKKSANILLISTIEGNNMTLDFEHLETGTFNFPTFENDPNATCNATFVYSNTTLKFIKGGEISVVRDGNNYTLAFDNIEAINSNSLFQVVEHVTLHFTGVVL